MMDVIHNLNGSQRVVRLTHWGKPWSKLAYIINRETEIPVLKKEIEPILVWSL